jgi:hypothetical protein
VSGRHAEGDGHTPLVPVALRVGLLDQTDAGSTGDGRIPGNQAKEVVA